MSIQVFISYKSEYRDFAREVKSHIHSWGYKSWLDVDEIPDGSYFRFEIDKGLKTSDVVVGVITQEAQESREVLFELDFAIKKNKPLLPLKYRDCELMYHLESIQWIDFTQDPEAGFERLHKRLTQLAASHAAPEAEVASSLPADAKPSADYFAGELASAKKDADDGIAPDKEVIGDILSKPGAPIVTLHPSAPISPLMTAAPTGGRTGGGIFETLMGVLMLPFAGIAALFRWLRSSGRDEAELARTNRAVMLDKVQEFWVVGVLENALKESGAFDLGLSAAPGAVLRHIDYGDYTLPTSANIGDVFNDLNRELLILGAPGAGKTIMLLQLAKALIKKAKGEPQRREESRERREEPIPVVFNLSSWAVERKPLEAWLVDELRLKYQVPKKVAEIWVKTEQLTLLLDGLDEVAEEYRNACVDAINVFRQTYAKTDLAVCSRIADYDVLTSRLDVRGAITLQPLSLEQVNNYLDRPELSALRETLKSDATLQDMSGTPFLLNTMAYAYRDASPISLKIPDGGDPAKARRKHLFDAYVEKRLALTPDASPSGRGERYTAAQTRHYLAWLAGKMVEFKQSVFYIESLQPRWLLIEQQKHLYRLIVRKLFGLDDIEIVDSLTWSLNRLGLVFGIAFGLAFGLLGGLLGGLSIGVNIGLTVGLTVGLAFGLAFGLASGVVTIQNVSTRSQPNQGIYRSLWNAFQVWLMFGPTVGLAVGLVLGGASGLTIGLTIGLAIGLASGLDKGGEAVLKHSILRLVLARSGAAPLNYARFLDYAASVQILRKVGGGYTFIHRYLLEYFAELEA